MTPGFNDFMNRLTSFLWPQFRKKRERRIGRSLSPSFTKKGPGRYPAHVSYKSRK
jgi:hypothetical protein